ncbi:hypothetical protein CF328_g8831, partial [Tilletia controversa]
ACRNRQVSTASSGASSSTAVDATEEIVDVKVELELEGKFPSAFACRNRQVSTASSGASSSTAVDATEEIVDVEVDRSVQAPVPAAVAASVSTAVPTAIVAASTSVPIPAAAAGQHADVIKYTKGIHIDTAEDRGTDLPSFNSKKGKGILIDMLVAPVQPVAEDAYTKMPATSRRLRRVRTPLKSSIRPTFVPSYGAIIEDVVHDAGKLLSVEPGISTMERAVKSAHRCENSSGLSKTELATKIRTQMKEIKAHLSAPLETFGQSDDSAAADTTVEIIDIEVSVKVQPAVTGPNTRIAIDDVVKMVEEEMCASPGAQVFAPVETSFAADVAAADIDIDKAYNMVVEIFG